MPASAVDKVEGGQMGVNDGADLLPAPAPAAVDSRVRAGVELPGVSLITWGCQIATRVSIAWESRDEPGCGVGVLAPVVP